MLEKEKKFMLRNKPLAAIFDLDGTIVDTEPVYLESDRNFFRSCGMDYKDEINTRARGRGAVDFFRLLEEEFPGNRFHLLPLEEKMRLRDAAFVNQCRINLVAYDPVIKLVKLLHARKIPLAIASGSTPFVIKNTLSLINLSGYFNAIVSASEVQKGKPSPDVFFEAARRLNANPESCLVFEDSLMGVKAALDAGMACIALPDSREGPPHHPDFFAADIVVQEGPEKLNYDMIMKLFFPD